MPTSWAPGLVHQRGWKHFEPLLYATSAFCLVGIGHRRWRILGNVVMISYSGSWHRCLFFYATGTGNKKSLEYTCRSPYTTHTRLKVIAVVVLPRLLAPAVQPIHADTGAALLPRRHGDGLP